MVNIGNDIVDLNLAQTQSDWERTGFLEKQFTKKEQEEIKNSENSFLKVWLFWSMKEAAYKCYTQKVEKRFFAPKKFACRLTSEKTGRVTFGDLNFYTSSDLSSFYIHTTAANYDLENTTEINVHTEIGAPNLVDKNLKKRLQKETGILASAIQKRKTNVGAPQFYHHEKIITNTCSISHHGNYGAFTFSLEK